MNPPVILCCEDEASLLLDLTDELRDAGYRPIGAENGQQALEQIAVCRPDLILCDISMPEMDGHTLLHEVRDRHASLADVPFVFLTALSDRQHVIDGKRSGADDYLTKPIDFDLLLATVEAHLRLVRRVQATRGGAYHAQGFFTDLVSRAALAALDHLAIGVVLLGADNQALHTNAAAQRLLAETGALLLAPAITTPFRPNVLRDVLTEAQTAHAERRSFSRSLALSTDGVETRLLATVIAFTAGEERTSATPNRDTSTKPDNAAPTSDVTAAMLITAPRTHSALPEDTLMQLFGLTRTEARVARELAIGHAPEQIARTLNIAPSTVAFHLRNLFGKTQTGRQAELVALLLAAPLANHAR